MMSLGTEDRSAGREDVRSASSSQKVRGRKLSRVALLFLLPVILILTGGFILPILLLFYESLFGAEAEGGAFQAYVDILTSGYYRRSLRRTVTVSLAATLFSLLLSYPMAAFIVRQRSSIQNALIFLVISPILLSVVVMALGWNLILSPTGLVNTALLSFGIAETRLLWLSNNEFAVIVGLVHVYFGYMVLTIAASLGSLDPSLSEAAHDLGSSRTRVFVDITLPLSLPGVLAGSVLVFAQSFTAYVQPGLLGGGRVLTLPMLVEQSALQYFDNTTAAALSVVMTVVLIALLAALVWLAKGGRRARLFE